MNDQIQGECTHVDKNGTVSKGIFQNGVFVKTKLWNPIKGSIEFFMNKLKTINEKYGKFDHQTPD